MSDEENRRKKGTEKAQKVMEKERSDEEGCRKKETEREKRGNYYPNPINCGDCSFETHYEKELFEHVKMHIDQSEKRTTNVQNGHKNKTWTLHED